MIADLTALMNGWKIKQISLKDRGFGGEVAQNFPSSDAFLALTAQQRERDRKLSFGAQNRKVKLTQSRM